MKNLKQNILLFFSVLIVSLLLVELYLRWHPFPWLYSVTRNVVQQTHSEPSENPILGYLPQANISEPFRNLEFDTLVSINSKHMRDREYDYEKPFGVKRIVSIGDSFVFGWGVEEEEVVSEVLERKMFEDIEVLNLGVSGYCENQSFERLKTEGVKYQPDVVLFYTLELPEICMPDYYFEKGIMYGTYAPRDTWPQRVRAWLRKNIYLYSAIENFLILIKFKDENIHASKEGFSPREVEKMLTDFKELSVQNNFVPVLVYVPYKQTLEKGLFKNDRLMRDSLAGFAKKSGIGFIDLSEKLYAYQQTTGKSPYFKYDDHWNRDGHFVAAQAIWAYLKKQWVSR